jgi:hypothetical protein
VTKPVGYSRDSVERALTHHQASGSIKDWFRNHDGPGHNIGLIGTYVRGEVNSDIFSTKTLHESLAFVMALHSAEVAQERRERR